MTIGELIAAGFDYARRCRGLWLFGFLAVLTGGGSGSSGQGGRGAHHGGGLPHIPPVWIGPLILCGLALAVVAIILHFLSEGALIEGVARTRGGEKVTTGQGFRFGWAHFGVLFRTGFLIGAAMLLSLVALACPVFIGFHFGGLALGIGLCVLAVVVGIPWLVSLAMIHAFAARIAVLEDRRALDAIRRARLFLHGRILLGLKMIVAAFAGNLLITLVTVVATVAVVLGLVMLSIPLNLTMQAVVLAIVLLMPFYFLLGAISGTMNSAIWTVGYLAEVQA